MTTEGGGWTTISFTCHVTGRDWIMKTSSTTTVWNPACRCPVWINCKDCQWPDQGDLIDEGPDDAVHWTGTTR